MEDAAHVTQCQAMEYDMFSASWLVSCFIGPPIWWSTMGKAWLGTDGPDWISYLSSPYRMSCQPKKEQGSAPKQKKNLITSISISISTWHSGAHSTALQLNGIIASHPNDRLMQIVPACSVNKPFLQLGHRARHDEHDPCQACLNAAPITKVERQSAHFVDN